MLKQTTFTGAGLESPAEKFPSTFGRVQFWHDYPYALPNLVIGAIGLSAALTSLLFVKETLPVDSDKRHAESSMSIWKLLKYPGVAPVLLIYNYAMLLAYTFTAVFPVAQYTPVDLGGFGLTPGLIAFCTALNGVAQASWLLIAFPILHKRLGTGRLLWLCAFTWPFLFVFFPIYNFLARHGYYMIFWTTGPLMLAIFCGVSMAFSEFSRLVSLFSTLLTCKPAAVQLALNDISPSPETLGTLNAVALAAQSGIRSVAPAVATSIFAVGVKYHILWGQLFWLFQIVLACGLFIFLRRLPAKARGDVKPKQQDVGA